MTNQAQTAKAIRKELKEKFPNIKFSVTSEGFAGGNSVRISYRNGVPTSEVEKITDKYQYGNFNGMIDLYEYDNNRDDIPQSKYVMVSRDVDQSILDSIKAKIAREFGLIDPENDQEWFEKFNNWPNSVVWRELQTLTL